MRKVLIVDDETVVRKGIALGVDWASVGCQVVGEAENGEEGLELARRLSPDLIITDIRMPKINGIEMMNALRREGNESRVIVLSAYSDFSYARSALKFGADDYLLKPFRDDELLNTVKKIMTNTNDHDPLRPGNMMPLIKSNKGKYVMEAIDYIAQHYAQYDISITAIADSLGVSEGHLSHTFKKETEFTVSRYLTHYRIHMALHLLRDVRMKVYEVADQVGYRDVTYFGSTFKKLTGMSPSEYQDACR